MVTCSITMRSKLPSHCKIRGLSGWVAPSLNILTLQVPIVININFLQTISINSQEIRLWELINDHQRENNLIYYQILSTYTLRKSIETSLENLYVDTGASRVKADFVKNTCRHFTHSAPVSQDKKWGRGTENNSVQITVSCPNLESMPL